MFYFLHSFSEFFILFNVFKYITFRAVGASVTAFVISVAFGPMVIRWLSQLSVVNQTKREYAEKIHAFYASKSAVPTMGGILIVGSLLLSNVIWGNLTNRYLLVSLFVVLWFGGIGFLDDWLKLREKNTRGLSGFVKLAGQLALGVGIGLWLYRDPTFSKSLYIPFFKQAMIPLGLFFIPFVAVVLVGSSNALNLTDGLDGLAVGCLSFAAGAFAILVYLAGRADFAQYLGIPFVPGAGE